MRLPVAAAASASDESWCIETSISRPRVTSLHSASSVRHVNVINCDRFIAIGFDSTGKCIFY